MRTWDHYCYGFRARIEALTHILRGHDVRWRVDVDELCAGDIRCVNCPDIEDDEEGAGMLIWCRGRKIKGCATEATQCGRRPEAD
jgi:hypothetical protein